MAQEKNSRQTLMLHTSKRLVHLVASLSGFSMFRDFKKTYMIKS